MPDPTTTPDPAAVTAALAAAGALLHRLFDVGSVRKRIASVEALAKGLRADLGSLGAELADEAKALRAEIAEVARARPRRTDTGSQPRVTVMPPAPALAEIEEVRRRLDVLERAGETRDTWERSIDVLLARLDERFSVRRERAANRDRGSDG